MYSFAQRTDTKVFDEPLYGYYLANSPAKDYHPGAQEVLNTMELDGQKVVEMMMSDHGKAVLFFKQMTHHILDLDRSFMKDCRHLILTRDPAEMLPSYAKEIEHPSMKDVGYADHLELIDYFKKQDIPFAVLDSRRILENPNEVLSKTCQFLDIPFDKGMLSWQAGARPEDGSWAKYWYANVHRSTAFQAYKPKNEPIPAHLEELYLDCQPVYEELVGMAL
jgi:hypothetical protein